MSFILSAVLSYAQDYEDYEYSEKKKKRMAFIPRYPLEIGIQLGTTYFLGDLGGTANIGQGFIVDADLPAVRPSVSVFARYSMGGHFSFRLEMGYLNLAGDDKWAGSGFSATSRANKDGWFRFYRNLNFQTHIFELTSTAEITPHNFKLTRGNRYSKTKQNVLSPYGLLGVGFIVFSPQGYRDGAWVDLHPLRTEGQGPRHP